MEHRLWLQGAELGGSSPGTGRAEMQRSCMEVGWFHTTVVLEQDFDLGPLTLEMSLTFFC